MEKISTIFDHIGLSRDTLLLVGDRFYSIEYYFDNSNNFMVLYGSKSSIYKSEIIKDVEKRTFISNQESIHKEVNEIFINNQAKLEEYKGKIRSLDSISKTTELEIEKFFLFDVYLKYKGRSPFYTEFQSIDEEGDNEDENFNFDVFLKKERVLLSETYDSPGILIHNRRVFRVMEGVINEDEKIHINNRDYGIGNFICSSKEFAEVYKNRIYLYIKNIITENQKKWLIKAEKREKQTKELEKIIEEGKRQLSNEGEIRLDCIGDDKYNFYLIFPKFVFHFKKDDEYYLLEGNKAGFVVTTKKRGNNSFDFSINNAPNVFNKPYKHPHWNANEEVFCDGKDEWKYDGYAIRWDTWINVNQSNRDFIAKIVAYLVYENFLLIHKNVSNDISRWDTKKDKLKDEFLGIGEEGKLKAERTGCVIYHN